MDKDLEELFLKKLNEENMLIPEEISNSSSKDDIYFIYNEISLQLELGKYLEKELNRDGHNNYKIFFEKNMYDKDTKYTEQNKADPWIKRKADIVIVDKKNNNKYAIELKFVRKENFHVPVSMYEFIEDIHFMEQVKEYNNYTETYNLIIVNNKNFFTVSRKNNEKNSETYKYYKIFRNEKEKVIIPNNQEYYNPVEKGKKFKLYNNYDKKWERIFKNNKDNNYRYLFIKH